ncbi:metal-dependent phosphohydrolase hd domain-containing [Stemphylium lycopersici]|uniref:Metal-dependent phosphohydrolase hd domain-containing n=1 Tax=Stemphylium lycopersici TaxID=183478 RepID=A0A364N852_STELY|nr:metal-dependent phosphohydrolase hd domain-containing [Stemphylium lycopersici]RAR04210.1 metal-dependent phosphohydrolase hd domain-containing [Stemphylium lycopersici]RAR13462.1 metal-dependent phosphohydrolase hd domain-containing [Stemphylium lycopersici]
MASNHQNPLPVPQVPIKDADKKLFTLINTFVHEYMSKYDNSHDYQHILRVLSNTNRILQAENETDSSVAYDKTSLFLAALLHDVGDHKYTKAGEDVENQIANTLLQHGAPKELARKVQTIVKHVSYTNEIRDPTGVASVLEQHPELAIVQDADRLDAIGAVGIARCFSFGAAKFPEQPMDRAIDHFGEKLYKLAGMMKTTAGKEMAKRRHDVLKEFAREWEEETHLSFQL